MIPMRVVETMRDGFDEPVVELWRDDEFIGMVFWDEDTAVVQIYGDDDGDVKDLDVRELLRVLDVAESIVSPYAMSDPGSVAAAGEPGDGWQDEDPATLALAEGFDHRARHRSDDGEGFFSTEDAEALIRRCDELDLAVVEMEAFELGDDQLTALAGQTLHIELDGSTPWNVFRPTANARATDTLLDWDPDPTTVVAFVIALPSGETFVA
ncbi:MAG: hypothetical protein H0V96_06620 [Acidimicrobiia bacterium]|nr:hypothetical protein [Acidimicrobiia bacterium]